MESKNKWMSSKLVQLSKIIEVCHHGQCRADGKIPYFTHPLHVAMLVHDWGGSEVAQAVALSHDVLEDCPDIQIAIWEERLAALFPEDYDKIYKMVVALTVPKAAKGLNRAERMRVAHIQIKHGGPEVALVKLADRLHNLQTIRVKKPEFIKIYCRETRELLETVKDTAVKNGWTRPWGMVEFELRELEKH